MARSIARRRLRRFLIAIVGLAIAGLVLASVPLPIGWAIELAVGWNVPPGVGATVHVDGAKLRWRPWRDTALIELRRVAMQVKGKPLASIGPTIIEIDKRELRHGHYAPRRFAVINSTVVIDVTDQGAFAALTSSWPANTGGNTAKPKPVTGPLPDVFSMLLAPGTQAQISAREFSVDYVLPGLRWSLRGALDVALTRRADVFTADATIDVGVAGKQPIEGHAGAMIDLRTGRVDARFAVPEFWLNQMPDLPTGTSPIDGAMAISARGSYDLAQRLFLQGDGEFSFRDGRVALAMLEGPPIAIERVLIRGGAERRNGIVAATLKQGTVAIEGAKIDLHQLELDIDVGRRSRVRWNGEISNLDGKRLAAHLPAEFTRQIPWLPNFLRESSLARFEWNGAAEAERNSSGALIAHNLVARQRVDGRIGDAALNIEIAMQQIEDAPIAATVKVDPLEPRRMARAFPAEWQLAAAAFPVELDATARVERTGTPLDGTVKMTWGPGEILPFAWLHRGVALRQSVVEAKISDRGSKLELPRFAMETSLGTVRVSGLSLAREATTANVQGAFELADVPFGDLASFVPESILKSFREIGVAPGDLGLTRAATTFAAALKNGPDGGWNPAKAEITSDLDFLVWGKPLSLRAATVLSPGETRAVTRVACREFSPAQFGHHIVSGVDLSDFRFPVSFEAESRVAPATRQLESATLRVQIGAGEARVAALDAAIPFRGVAGVLEWDVAKNAWRIPSARVDLAPDVVWSVEGATATLAPLRATGVVKCEPLSLSRALSWWPEGVLPERRREARAMATEGTLLTRGIEFAVEGESPSGALKIARARGEIVITKAAARPMSNGGPMGVEKATLALDFPRGTLLLENATARGVSVPAARFEIVDILAPRLEAKAQVTFISDLGAAVGWLDVTALPPELHAIRQSTGQLRGELNGKVSVAGRIFSDAALRVVLNSEKLTVPQFFDGPVEARFDLEAPSLAAVKLNGTLAIGEATWLGRNRHAVIRPLTIALTARDWQTANQAVIALAVRTDSFLGLPLSLKANAEFLPDGVTLNSAAVEELVLGRTDLRADWRNAAGQDTIAVLAKTIDLGEIATVAAPWLDVILAPQSTAAKTEPDRAAIAPATVSISRANDVKLEAARIEFGRERRLRNVVLDAVVAAGWPERFRMTATEGDHNRVEVSLMPAANGQQLQVLVEDAAALAQTVTEPSRAVKLPAGSISNALASAAEIPEQLAGGRVKIDAAVTRVSGEIFAKGKFEVTDGTMIKGPWWLGLLALRTAKSLETKPLIRRLAGEWSYDTKTLTATTAPLEGTGLINRVTVKTFTYTFSNEKVAVDGEYFGVPFEVVGTRADPQVFLKETSRLKLVLQPDSGFFDYDSLPKSKK